MRCSISKVENRTFKISYLLAFLNLNFSHFLPKEKAMKKVHLEWCHKTIAAILFFFYFSLITWAGLCNERGRALPHIDQFGCWLVVFCAEIQGATLCFLSSARKPFQSVTRIVFLLYFARTTTTFDPKNNVFCLI